MTRPRFTSPLRALERRLARARPKPEREYAQHTGRILRARWADVGRPAGLRLQLAGLLVAGSALLLVALVLAVS